MQIVLTLCGVPLSHWYWPPFICASHADFRWSQSRRVFAKATRAVGEEVKFSAEFDSVASCEDPLHNLTTHWNNVLSEKEKKKKVSFLLRPSEAEMDRTSSLKITADSNQSAVPAQKTQIYEASKGHRLQSSVCSFTERSVITVHYKVTNTKQSVT